MSIELCHKFSDCDKMLIEVNGKLGTMNYYDYWFSNDIYLWVFDEDKEWKLHEILHFPLEKEPNESSLYMFTIRKYGTEEIVFANITSKSVENVMITPQGIHSWLDYSTTNHQCCPETISSPVSQVDGPLVPILAHILPTKNTPQSSSSSSLQTHSYSTSPSDTQNEETSTLSCETVPALSEDAPASPL
uniref:Uncharacterized protein n=1 Tax=Solanum lycopersicum TaxID=4081 RepID=A0A3Q7GFY6_SOLLC